MRPVLTAEEMRAADRETIERIGVPGVALMESAGAAVARVVEEACPVPGRVLVVCGKGNNGGDGFVTARRLLHRDVRVVLLCRREEVKGDARTHLEALLSAGGRVLEARDEEGWLRHGETLFATDLIVDAVLGTGISEAPRGNAALAIQGLLEAGDAGIPVVAVDLPSGLSADTGAVVWPTVVASTTVTFAAYKHCHVMAPACERSGEVVVADIGIPRAKIEEMASCFVLEARDAWAAFPERPLSMHKGQAGRILVIAGSVGKSGAASLAAEAALRSGAGLVTVATARSAQAAVAASCREIMTEGLPETEAGRISASALEAALRLAAASDVVVLGPGIGTDESTRELVRGFVGACPVPLVVDADGLNCLSPVAGSPPDAPSGTRLTSLVLTPHPGEAGRLLGWATDVVQQSRLESARRLARLTGATVVLKGHRSLVVGPDGVAAVNPTGNPALATAGTGDVLAGIVGATLARCDPWPGACGAVFVHGRAGDLVAESQGATGLLAGDLLAALPGAIQSIGGARPCVR